MNDTVCERYEDQVSAYVDDELTPEARAEIESHVAACGSCATLVADLRRLGSEARAMPLLAPSRDLWPAIEARIEAPVIPLAEVEARSEGPMVRQADVEPRRARTRQLSPRWLAAAAAALVAVSSGVTYLVTTRSDAGPVAENGAELGPWVVTGGERTGEVVNAGGGSPPAATSSYDAELARLQAMLAERRSQLDSSTVATIERTLRVIDDAIAESREAIARDPGSPFLHEQLDRTLERRIELMRALALMPSRS